MNEDMRKQAMQMKQMENQANALQQNLQEAKNTISSVEQTIEGLKNLEGKKEANAMLPIGPGVVTKAKIEDNDKVLVNVGAGIFTWKKPGKAVSSLKDKKDQLIEVKKNLEKQVNKVQQSYQQIASKVQKMAQEQNVQ